MDAASPARLYATVAGAFLVVLGIAGFFYSASFGAPGTVEEALGAFRCNAWVNLLHVATGALGLLAASVAARSYSLVLGLLYTGLAIWGLALGGSDAILGFLPAGGGNDALHLALGLLGLAAVAGTPSGRTGAKAKSRPKPRRKTKPKPAAPKRPASKPRTNPARDRA